MSEEDRESEWRYSVDEFEESPTEVAARGENDADADGDSNVAGEFAPASPVVPERPTLENAAFVTLGAVLAMLALASLILPSFGQGTALIVILVVGGIGAVAYGAFARLTPDT